MAKPTDMTFADVDALVSYDPETGRFTWKVSPCRRMKAGDPAGSLKNVRVTTGKVRKYLYLRLKYMEFTGARVAWLLQTGEWPTANVMFKDDDSSNLRWANLKLADFESVKYIKDGRRVHKMSPEASRHHNLKRYYGLTGEEYGAMVAAQGGLCMVCKKPETAMFNGRPKAMHVDHCHETGVIRAILCGSCNQMLGNAKDDPSILRAAADYIEEYAAKVHELRPSTGIYGARKK